MHLAAAAQKSRGFGTVTLVVATAFIAVVAIAMLSTVRTERSSVYPDKVLAAELIQQGRDLSDAFRLMVLRGAPAASITFTATGTAGLFNRTVSGLEMPRVPGAALAKTTVVSPMWIYRGGEGTFAGRAKAHWFVLGELTEGTCNQVNAMLGNGNPAAIAALSSDLRGSADTTIPALSVYTSAVDLSAWMAGATVAPPMGCIQLEDGGRYMYAISI